MAEAAVAEPEVKPDLAPENTQGKVNDKPQDGSLIDTKPEALKDGETSPDKKPTDQNKTADKPTETVKPVVPEIYEAKLPEGMVLNPELKTKFDALAKGLNLTQEQYQQVVDVQAQFAQADSKAKLDAFHKSIADWKEETTKELGADTDKALSLASKGIDTIFKEAKENKEFREMLSNEMTGLGNWKLMVKAFSFIGKIVSEDKFVDGNPGTGDKKPAEKVIYDSPAWREKADAK